MDKEKERFISTGEGIIFHDKNMKKSLDEVRKNIKETLKEIRSKNG